MDAQRKTQLEQRMVIGLLGVFAVTLAMSLKHSELFGGRAAAPAPAAPAVVGATGARSLVDVVASYRERMEPKVESPVAKSAPPEDVPVARSYTAHDARDPFESQLPRDPDPVLGQDGGGWLDPSTGGQAPGGPPLVVQGILWGGTRPTAIINDEVYGIGDRVEGATVTAIDRGGVTLEVDGGSMRLTLSGVFTASLPAAP